MLAVGGDSILLAATPVLLTALLALLAKMWTTQTKQGKVLEDLSTKVLPWFEEPGPEYEDRLTLPSQTRANQASIQELRNELHAHMVNEEELTRQDVVTRNKRQDEMDTFKKRTTRDIRKIKRALGIVLPDKERDQ